jgi:hypothetical protein
LKLMSSFYDKYLDIGADFGCDVGSISWRSKFHDFRHTCNLFGVIIIFFLVFP